MPKEPVFKLPKSLAACADLYHKTKQERLAQEKVAAKTKENESILREHLINNLSKGEQGGVQGKVVRVAVVLSEEPTVEDEEKLHAYIVKNKAWDLLTKAISKKAVLERWNAKKVIPGVGKYTVVKLSCNKV